MFYRMWKVVSFGRRYLLASFIYVGLGLILGNTIPASPVVANIQNPCPAGMVCCDDNTSGTAATCACCSASEGQPTTIQCEQPAPVPPYVDVVPTPR
jgi:hypothetical protein